MKKRGVVLVIEDDDSTREMLRIFIKEEGFYALGSPTVNHALKVLSVFTPCLVILDFVLPDHPGTVFLTKLKTDHPQIPVIVITACRKYEVDKIEELKKAEAILFKPFAVEDFINLINLHCSLKKPVD